MCGENMGRRYLTPSEVASALARGKHVEAFLGGFDADGIAAIRWLDLNGDGSQVYGEVWESPDCGSEDYVDVYGFGSLNGDDEPAIIFRWNSIEEAFSIIDSQFPGATSRLVNQGVVQKEYLDYKRSCEI
jgi:hypothetical protein